MWEKILSFIFRKDEFQPGALVDDRSEDERKEQDILVAETVAEVVGVVWKEIPKGEIRHFQVQNQNQKSDCVAETRRKLNHIIFKVNRNADLDFSSVDLYRRRVNYPNPGMQAHDAIRLCREEGMTLDVLAPSDAVLTEASANTYEQKPHNKEIAKVFTTTDDVVFNAGDLLTPAGTIQKTRKAVMAWYYFTAEEWSREVPIILTSLTSERDPRASRHSVTAIEPALYMGQRGWWIEDSAHFGGLSRRFITEDFHKKRNFWSSYPMNFHFEQGASPRPSYDGSVVSLQNCLKFEGLFPLNIDSTGYYGKVTTDAVKAFQQKYGMEQVGTVGKLTTAKLKSLYP